jgi:hypothetical protein
MSKPSLAGDVRAKARAGKMIRPRRLADALDVAPGTIYGWIARGQVQAVVVGRTQRIPPSEALRLLGEQAA